jgi:hypothetical protein
MTIEFQKETPVEVQKWILEALLWVDASDVRKTLLASRMENIYFHGKLDGVVETSERAVQTIKRIGVQS